MNAITKAMNLGWPVFPGAHTTRTDIIGENIQDWNWQARQKQEAAERLLEAINEDKPSRGLLRW